MGRHLAQGHGKEVPNGTWQTNAPVHLLCTGKQVTQVNNR